MISHAIESAVLDFRYGKLPIGDELMMIPNPANLRGLREDAYRENSSRAMDTRRERIVAWSVGSASLHSELDHESTVRLEAVLRMPYVFNRIVTPATLEVREFTEPTYSDEDRFARLSEGTTPIIGMYTTYRTNTLMDKLVVARGPLTLDLVSNRGVKWSHLCNMKTDQPEWEGATKPKDYVRKMHDERMLEKIDSGKIGNLLVPTENDVLAFEQELERGASGLYTALPPLRAW